ncbi:MAG TPA: hypothetical protein VNJ04_00885 [Gemmatimonadaceae bacterium]|nr:hypothetical protein [Gemmatimonadaceae bacterium]
MFASTAEAKLNPAFSERVAQAGDLVAIDVGEGSEQFLGPLRIYLVPLEAADQLRGGADPRLVKIGELGRLGEFGTPRVLTFEVPDLLEGEYTAAIWFRGYETGTWANALEGIHPLLTIGAADEGAIEGAASAAGSDEAGMPLFWPVAIAGGILVGAFLGFGWRRGNRRPTSGASAS